jgi:hypothetical protein
MKYLHDWKSYALGVADRLGKRLTRAARAVAEAWRRHRDRIAEEPGYAEAFVTVVIAAIELTTGNARIRTVIRELTAAYVAVLRALRPRSAGYRWDWPTHN